MPLETKLVAAASLEAKEGRTKMLSTAEVRRESRARCQRMRLGKDSVQLRTGPAVGLRHDVGTGRVLEADDLVPGGEESGRDGSGGRSASA